MIKIIVFMLCVLSISSASILIDSIEHFLQNAIVKILNEDIPKKVKSIQELELRSNECAVLDFIAIVKQYGYTAEEYSVTTKDGYILKLHRVSGSPSSPKRNGKPVIFINHGILTDSDFYVLRGPEHDLVYLLADKGYDVWLGNTRGTSYSRSHVKYSISNPKFWDFSLDEQALLDTPAFIDYILEKTEQEKLTYVGYSMGTTESYMLLSSKLEYNDKVNLLISIAPVVYFTPPMDSLLKFIIKTTTEITTKLGITEVLPQACTIGKVGETFCRAPEPNVCSPFVEIFSQANKMNISHNLPKFLNYFPSGVGNRVIEHYNQMIETKGKFQKFDFSYEKVNKSLNMQKYNQTEPPKYNVSLVTVPVGLFCAPNDIFVPKKNAKLLRKNLPNVETYHLVSESKFNHLDFFWNVNTKELVYDHVIDFLSRQLKIE